MADLVNKYTLAFNEADQAISAAMSYWRSVIQAAGIVSEEDVLKAIDVLAELNIQYGMLSFRYAAVLDRANTIQGPGPALIKEATELVERLAGRVKVIMKTTAVVDAVVSGLAAWAQLATKPTEAAAGAPAADLAAAPVSLSALEAASGTGRTTTSPGLTIPGMTQSLRAKFAQVQ